MKEKMQTQPQTQDEKRFVQRVYYYEKVKKMPHDEAVRLAKNGKLRTQPGTDEGQLSAWKQRQLARQKNQVTPMPVSQCPNCDAKFGMMKTGEKEWTPVKLPTCPSCGKRFYCAG